MSDLADSSDGLLGDVRDRVEELIDTYRADLLATVDGLTEDEVRLRLVPSKTTSARSDQTHDLCGGRLVRPGRDRAARTARSESPRHRTVRSPDPGRHHRVDRDRPIAGASTDSRPVMAGLDFGTVVEGRGSKPVWALQLQVLREMAQHTGHADILREQILATKGQMTMYDAVLFDLLTGLVDSWSLWNRVAGDAETGRRWRLRYLEVGYATGAYRPYEELVAEAAEAGGTAGSAGRRSGPATGTPVAVAGDRRRAPRAVRPGQDRHRHQLLGRPGPAGRRQVWARRSMWCSPPRRSASTSRDPEAYRAGLAALGSSVERTLFVAGSPYDLSGAAGVGLDVWWHNRAGLDRGDRPAPVAEHDSLRSVAGLPRWVGTGLIQSRTSARSNLTGSSNCS